MRLEPMLLCALVVSGVCFYPTNAQADDAESEDTSDAAEEPHAESSAKPVAHEAEAEPGATFEIALTTTVASYSKLAYTLDIPIVGNTDGDITSISFGPSANPVTIEFGYLLSSQFSVGLLLEIGSTSTTTKSTELGIDQTQTLARFMVGPRASFLFSDTGAVRPFAMAAIGFTTAPQTDSADARSISFSGFEAMGGLGLHWFLAPSFSIEPALRVGWGLGSGKVDQRYRDAQDMVHAFSDVPASGSLLTGALLLGASGWVP